MGLQLRILNLDTPLLLSINTKEDIMEIILKFGIGVGGRLKKNIKKIKNFNEIHVYTIGSYNRGKYSGEWITYFFDGRVQKKVTYDGKGKELKHIEYDYEGRVKSNTGYKL